jgi:hypothetical protein
VFRAPTPSPSPNFWGRYLEGDRSRCWSMRSQRKVRASGAPQWALLANSEIRRLLIRLCSDSGMRTPKRGGPRTSLVVYSRRQVLQSEGRMGFSVGRCQSSAPGFLLFKSLRSTE